MRSFSTLSTLGLFGVLSSLVQAQRPIPDGLKKFRDDLKAGGPCKTVIKDGLHDGSNNPQVMCGDHKDDLGVVYTMSGNGGEFSDMDIDCDGADNTAGRCGNDGSGQAQTAFQSDIQGYNAGIEDLNAGRIPYVVLGNDPAYQLQDSGVKPLSVVAVVCGEQLVYGVWGDTNGADTTGEASIALATICFGESMTGNSGHGEHDVLYLGFTGDEAVPGAQGAAWDTSDPAAFEKSIEALGNKLVSKFGGAGATTGSPANGTSTGTPQQGAPQQSGSQQGAPQQGTPQPGTPQQGAPTAQQSAPQPGAPQPGTPQQGAPTAQQSAPQPGAPQPGAPQSGAPQPGAPQSGAPQPGAPQPGAPQPGAPQQGAPGAPQQPPSGTASAPPSGATGNSDNNGQPQESNGSDHSEGEENKGEGDNGQWDENKYEGGNGQWDENKDEGDKGEGDKDEGDKGEGDKGEGDKGEGDGDGNEGGDEGDNKEGGDHEGGDNEGGDEGGDKRKRSFGQAPRVHRRAPMVRLA